MTNPIIRGLCYCRVSTDEQTDNNSLPEQQRVNEEKLRSLGCTEIDVVLDADSGSEWEERGELSKYLDKIKSGYYQFVCVESVNRALRDWELVAYLNRTCKQGDARLVYATRDYGDHRGGKLMEVIDAFGAQWWKEDLLAAMMRGRKGRINSGKVPLAGPEKYGWRRNRDTDNGKPEIIEAEAAIVRLAADHLDTGLGFRATATLLTESGFRTRSGAQWSANALHRIFTDPAYKGEAYAFRYTTRKGATRKGVTQLKPQADWIKLSEGYPPILTAEQWDRINQRHQANRGITARNQKRPALLRGLVFCDLCNSPAYCTTRRRRLPDGSWKIYRYYSCGSQVNQRGCPGVTMPAEFLELDVWAKVVKKIKSHPGDLQKRAASGRETKKDPSQSELKRLKKLIAQKDTEADRVAASLRRATRITAPRLEKELERIETEKQTLQSQLEALQREQATESEAARRMTEIVEFCQSILEKLPTAPQKEQRELLEVIGWRVYLKTPKTYRYVSFL